MKPAAYRLLLGLALGLLAFVPASGAPQPPGPHDGSPAPAFDLPTIDGRRVTLEGLRGKTVVVNVWATWCPPCQRETPDLVSAYKRLGGRDVVFVGVDSTERPALVRAFAAAKNIGWIEAIDEQRTFLRAYGVRYFPTTYVIDPNGILRVTYVDVVTPKLIAEFVRDARAGRNGVVVSALQQKIDALLAPGKYQFTGAVQQRLATIERARKALMNVDDWIGDSDPSSGNPVDLPRAQAEENALRVRTIAALRPLAMTAHRRVELLLLEGDRDTYLGRYAQGLSEYLSAARLDPKNADALQGSSMCARYTKQYGRMLWADRRLVALSPQDVESLVGLGVDAGVARKFSESRFAFNRAVAIAAKRANAPGATSKDIRMLAWAHLYDGRMEAKAGDPAAARAQFALAMQAAIRLPKTDSRYTIYLEQAQEETVALDLGSKSRATTAVSLAPWTGPELPGSAPDTAKYRLVLTGPAGKTVALRAADLPKGWIASFCLDRICAPLRVTTTLPSTGVKVIEFQVVPPDARSLAHVPSVRVIATAGGSVASSRT